MTISSSIVTTDLVPYLITYAILCLGWYLLHTQQGTFVLPTIPNVFFWFHAGFIAIGSPVIFSRFDHHDFRYLGSIWSACLLFPAGVWLASQALRHHPRKEIAKYKSPPIELDSKNTWSPTFLWFALFLICLAVAVAYIRNLSTIPILAIFRTLSNPEDIARFREGATVYFSGKAHWYDLFLIYLAPFLSCLALIHAAVTKETLWKFVALFSILFSSFILVITAQKAPIATFLLQLLCAFVWISGGKNAVRYVVIGGSTITLFLFLFYFAIFFKLEELGDNDIAIFNEIIGSIAARVFLTQTNVLHQVFLFFPSIQDYLYGASFPNPGRFLPHQPFPLTYFIYDTIYPFSPVRGSAPTAFYGEVYANFGWFFMMLSQAFLGFIIQSIHVLFIRGKKTAIQLAMMISFTFIFNRLALTGLHTLLLSIPFLLFVWILSRFCLSYLDYYPTFLRSVEKID